MERKDFNKETFKKNIIDNVKNRYRVTIDEATPQQIFQAVAYAIKDIIIDEWIATHKLYKAVSYTHLSIMAAREAGLKAIEHPGVWIQTE